MHPEDSRTSPPDVRSAALQRRTLREALEKCLQLFALIAAKHAKCPSSPPKARLFTAASASRRREQKENNISIQAILEGILMPTGKNPAQSAGFFFFNYFCKKTCLTTIYCVIIYLYVVKLRLNPSKRIVKWKKTEKNPQL